MSDLVERLRTAASNNRIQAERGTDSSGHRLEFVQVVGKRTVAAMHDEAADEIEALRAMLRRIDNLTTWETTPLGRDFQEEVDAILNR